MKQYLWVGLAVAFIGANASDNPFDLKENFGKLDQDQEVLLSELKKIAAKKALVEEEAEKTIAEEKQVEDENVQEGAEEVLPSLNTNTAEEGSSSGESIHKSTESTKNEVKDTFMKNTGEEKVKTVLTSVAKEKSIESNKSIEIKKNEVKENEALLQAIKEKESELERAKEEARKIEEAKKEAERREVEAYEKQRAEKLARKKVAEVKQVTQESKLPDELQKMKDIIEVKVKGNTKALEGEVKNIFERLLKEKDNPDFSLADAQKIIDGNKKAGMAIITYMMAKSMAQYNQLTPSEKKAFDKKAMEAIEKDMENDSSGNTQKEKMDEYAKKYPNEVRALGFAFLEDILTNGIPQVDFNMQMSAEYSSEAGESGTITVTSGSNIKTKEKQSNIVDINVTRENAEEKIMADKAYEEAVIEMSQED